MSLIRRHAWVSFLFAFVHAQIASAAVTVSWPKIGGTNYSVPQAGESGWANLTNYLVALQNAQGTTSQTIGVRTATTTPITVSSANDTVIVVKLTVPGPSTVNLPAGFTGQYFVVVDGTGDASTSNITIDPNGTQTINGALTYAIAKDRKAVLFVFNGTAWNIVSEFGSSSFTASNGILVQTAPDVYAARTITAGSGKIAIANGNGVAGNPTVDLGSVTGSSGLVAQTGGVTYAARTLTAGSSKVSVSNGDGVAGNPTVDVSEANLTLGNIGGTLGITKGGTGQTTQTAAYTALSPLTTKGDLVVSNGTNPVRLGIGSDTFVLTADSAQATGVKWAVVPSGFANPMTTQGDLIVGGAAGAPQRLAGVATGNAFISGGVGALPSWGKIDLTTTVSGALPIANGGTGQTTKAAAFDALSPMTTAGDIIYGGTSGTGTRLATGTAGQLLQTNAASAPSWVSVFTPPGGASAVGTPTYSWSGTSNNTGLYLSGTDAVGLSSDGTQTWNVSSGGAHSWGIAGTNNTHTLFGSTLQMGDGGTKAVRIQSNTSDGTDDYRAFLSSGGAAGPTRGAYLEMHGNEFSSAPGRILFESGSTASGTATAWQVNVGASSVSGQTIDGNGAVTFAQIHNASAGNLTSGRYTPTGFTGTNTTAVTPSSCHYSRVGNTVTESCTASVTVTTVNIATSFSISLPIPSNLIAGADLLGSGTRFASSGTNFSPVYVSADSANDRALVEFNPTNSGANAVVFTFQYEVK